MTIRVSDADFIATWQKFGSPQKVAEATGLQVRGVYTRRERLQKRGVILPTTSEKATDYAIHIGFDRRREIDVRDGSVLIGSDAHFWPGEPSLAYRAFLEVARQVEPKVVIFNGDLLDAPTVTRHEPPGYRYQPTLKQEIEVLQDRLADVVKAAPNAERYRTLGNHDVRFERHLAVHAPQYAGIEGTSLSDHIPGWPCSWTVLINGNVMVRHRQIAGGIHSAYQSTLRAGLTYIHGHLHKLLVSPYSDYNGLRWGVDTGTLADIDSEAFDYAEDGCTNWRAGFVVLTFRKGKLLWPDLCYVDDGNAIFRGEVVL